MDTTSQTAAMPRDSFGLLDRNRTIAQAGFNRWLVPPAALAIHLCIGMAYGFSVFWLPLSRALGISKAVSCPDLTLLGALVTTSCDWRVADLGWMFTLFFVFLGSSAALWGGWLERTGPRRAGVVAALCWCGGMLISALGVYLHQLWMMWLGSGVIGGIGLGLGYISPVSTLIKWFPDRRGMATGMAIMGFGGGAMIGAPLANALMNHFHTADSVGVWQTFVVMAAIYVVFMLGGAFGYRVPPVGWRPDGWTPPARREAMITHGNVHLAMRTHAAVLADLGGAVPERSRRHRRDRHGEPMLQEIFGGALIGRPELGFVALDDGQRRRWRRSPPGSPGFCRCSISAGGSSGPRCPTCWAAGPPIRPSSCWALPCTPAHPGPPMPAARRCSCCSSASSCRCTAAASPPCRPTWRTSSARSSSAPSTDGC